MNVSVILAHPREDSFNAALARAAADALEAAGHIVIFHDLYRERFAPVVPAEETGRDAVLDPLVARHCRELAADDGIVIVHPNWWGQPPAILKGWIDRVVRPGVAYRFREGDGGEGVPEGLLQLRQALVLNTSDTPAERERTVFGDPLETLWKECVFGFCGVRSFARRTYGVVVTSSPATRAGWLADARVLTARHFPAGGGR